MFEDDTHFILKMAVSHEQKPCGKKHNYQTQNHTHIYTHTQDEEDNNDDDNDDDDDEGVLTLSLWSKSTELETEVRRSYRSGVSECIAEATLWRHTGMSQLTVSC